MSEAKFTKGPWSAISNGSYYDIGVINDCSLIPISPRVCIGATHEDEANAHLIAAAPEMYELLREIRDMDSWDLKLFVENSDAIGELLAKSRGENA